jgi:methoxymalonate biosynthesis acyl carrier protein
MTAAFLTGRKEHLQPAHVTSKETDMDVSETVRQFIFRDILQGDDSIHLTSDTSLEALGILDSLTVLKLVSFLEDEFNLGLESADIEMEGFSSLANIERLVHRKIALRG